MRIDIGDYIEYILVAIIVIGIIPGVVSTAIPSGSHSFDPAIDQPERLGSTNNIPDTVSVSATKENALNFTSDSDSVEASAPQDLTNGSWSVCSAVELAPNANQNDTYTIFAYENASVLLQYDSGDWLAYYENTTGADATARLNATTPTAGFTPVCGKYNETSNELVVVADNTQSAATLSNTTSSRNVSRSWRGRIDEVRAFGTALNNSSLATYANDPIEPLPSRQRLARFMFDEGSGTSTAVYFAASSATISGPEWTTGLPDPGLSRGTDYELLEEPFRIVIRSGSYLEGAPVMHVSWGAGLIGLIVGFIPVAAGLLLVVVIGRHVQENIS